MKNLLETVKKIHFVGIGGSGMCPMAEILICRGYEITGSDMNESSTLDRIRSYNIPVFLGHSAENIGEAELVVYTAAAKDDNPELVEARAKSVPTLERSIVLGMLTKQFDKAIAISGTHGKTTTTSMVTQILLDSGFDPSAVIGGKLPAIGGNGRSGDSQYMVCEACEYVDTFLQLHPAVSVITNVEADHLDYFGTLDNIIKSFNKFANQTSECVVVNGDDKEAMKSVEGIKAKIITFGFSDKFDYYPVFIGEEETVYSSFTLMHKGEALCDITLSVPGRHNVCNALAACAACSYYGVKPEDIKRALKNFSGVGRRFEVLGEFNGVTVADDFAHHPTELTSVLTSATRMNFNNVWGIFQPHTFSRTHAFLDDFAEALAISDKMIITDILAVREENIYGITADDLSVKVPNSYRFSTFDEIADFVIENAKAGDLILTMGGGDIYKCANLIVDKYTK